MKKFIILGLAAILLFATLTVAHAQSIGVSSTTKTLTGTTGPTGLSGFTVEARAPEGVTIQCVNLERGIETCQRPVAAAYMFADLNEEVGANETLTFAVFEFSGAPGTYPVEFVVVQADDDAGDVVSFNIITTTITLGSN